MLLSALFTLCAGVLGRAVDDVQQLPLVTESVLRKIPGGSIVNLCPESKDSDLLAINRIVNEPQNPYLYVLGTINQLALCLTTMMQKRRATCLHLG